jgi:DeoR/GlpR family transcriptional regulator of sugar metabolism
MTTLQKLSKGDRQSRILAELRTSATIRISDLAAELGVSGETIRRDLLEMGESGLVSRTYGGAVARPFGFEPAWNERLAEMAEERKAIAALAARRIRPGDVVMVDAGSTALHFARRVAAEGKDLTVITNCFSAAMALGSNRSLTVISCPGIYDAHEGSLTGPDAVAYLARFNANWAVIGASGLSVDGPTEASTGGAAVKRTMLERAEQNMLLLDHAKLGRLNLVVVWPLTRIQRLITSERPRGELAAALRRAGTEVEAAQPS